MSAVFSAIRDDYTFCQSSPLCIVCADNWDWYRIDSPSSDTVLSATMTFGDSEVVESGIGPTEPTMWQKFLMPFKEPRDSAIAPGSETTT